MTRDDLHAIANAGGYGTGKAARDRLAAEAECLALLPTPACVPAFTASSDAPMFARLPLCTFGNSMADNRDWSLYADGVFDHSAIGHDPKEDAERIAAILNAYRMEILQPWAKRQDEELAEARNACILALPALYRDAEAITAGEMIHGDPLTLSEDAQNYLAPTARAIRACESVVGTYLRPADDTLLDSILATTEDPTCD